MKRIILTVTVVDDVATKVEELIKEKWDVPLFPGLISTTLTVEDVQN